MGSQQYCLRWNNHQTAVLSGFAKLLENEALVDVTIACGGIRIKAHKVVLSACSPYFQEIFEENPCKHPVVILKGFTFQDLKSMVDFMYKGEVNVDQKHLADFLKTAEELQISGLVDIPASSAGVDPVIDEDRRQASSAGVRSSDGAVRVVPVQHEHHGAQIAACNELRERLRSSDGANLMRNSSSSAAASASVVSDYEDSEQNRLMQHKTEQSDDHHRLRQHIELDPNDGDIDGTQNNNYMDSDCDGSLPMCPVDAELHVKEEVEILEEDLSVVNDESQLLLERLTRPHSSSDGVSVSTSVTRTFDLPSASNAQGVPSTVQMLESLPGHSSWSTTAAPPGPSRTRDQPSTGTDSAKRKRRRNESETGSDPGEYVVVNNMLSSQSAQRLKAPIKCPHCPQIFSSSTNRNRHIKHMHYLKPNERNFACTFCERAYRRKDNLTYHLRICHPEHPVDVELLRT